MWDQPPPVCRRKCGKLHTFCTIILVLNSPTAFCPDLSDPVNGVVSQTGNSAGDTGSYTCNDGFDLVGAPLLTCQEDGMWDEPPPECQSIAGRLIRTHS